MISPKPVDENERLSDLKSYYILDTVHESDFDEITQLASAICEVPVSLITFVDAERQWFKSSVGFDISETNRDISFCSHAIHQDHLMIIPDATKDPRFQRNPLVTSSPDVRFYAGMPLVTESGYKLGALCVLDRIPRQIAEHQKLALRVLGKQVIKLLELRKKNMQLQKLAEVNGRLLAIIGHDLRAPFNTLNGMLSIYESEAISIDEFKGLIPQIKKAVDGGSSLLENLLEWGSSQIHGQKIKIEKLGLKQLIDEVIAENIALLDEKGNSTIVEIGPDHLAFADKKMTEFIFRNLLLNANKFTEKGTISFSASSTGNFLEIKVTDTGIGIAENIRKNLFSWNKRVSKEGTRGEKGTGLGLLFCKEFIDAHGCQIQVASTLNEGTTFHFTLPVYS